MNLLLDTHAFIWLNSEPDRLSPMVRQLCATGAHVFYLSMASPWEMQIKHQLGKLRLDAPLDEIIQRNVERNAIRLLPIEYRHIRQLGQLPPHHHDPFDRMIIAQTMSEGMAVVSADRAFAAYGVPVIW